MVLLRSLWLDCHCLGYLLAATSRDLSKNLEKAKKKVLVVLPTVMAIQLVVESIRYENPAYVNDTNIERELLDSAEDLRAEDRGGAGPANRDAPVGIVRDVHEASIVGGSSGGLEEGGEKLTLVGEAPEVVDSFVLEQDVVAEDVSYLLAGDGLRELIQDGIKHGVLGGENGEGGTLVDLVGNAGLKQQHVQVGVVREEAENLGDVDAENCGSSQRKEDQDEKGGSVRNHHRHLYELSAKSLTSSRM
ncbi:hypothetical protein SELMODRAFT_420730 [Selaginella moellendorffii]|uniref:Uncharacterized protein n=1 Tax=Selaginella moellendorffii TaxID=88036 RepID=D8SCX8_SELML|nr:hypothetical protein SELMODRAFT_420730 [Selaginella moellendorffii]